MERPRSSTSGGQSVGGVGGVGVVVVGVVVGEGDCVVAVAASCLIMARQAETEVQVRQLLNESELFVSFEGCL